MRFVKRLLPSQDVDALLGDIVEESRRRSGLWYWSQLVAVLVVASWKDVRAHKWLAVRAIAVGIATIAAFGVVMGIGLQMLVVLTNGGYYVFGYWLTLPNIWPPDYAASVFAKMAINAIGFGLAGWAIARTHRGHGLAMVLPFLALMWPAPVAAAVIGTILTRTDYYGVMHVLPVALLILWPPAGILLGGILGTRPISPRRDEASVSGHASC